MNYKKYLIYLILTIILLSAFIFYKYFQICNFNIQKFNTEEKTQTSNIDNSSILPMIEINETAKQSILEVYGLKELFELYKGRDKIFEISPDYYQDYPKINKLFFLPYKLTKYESQYVFIEMIHGESKKPISIKGDVVIEKNMYALDFYIIREGKNFSLWRGSWDLIKKNGQEELLVMPGVYTMIIKIQDNSGETKKFNQLFEIF